LSFFGAVWVSTPIFDREIRNSTKLACIVCYQRCAERSGMGGNQKVVVANGLAKLFLITASSLRDEAGQ